MPRTPPPSFVLLFALLAVSIARTQNGPASAPNLESQLKSQIAGFHGQVSFYAHDLATGQTVAIDADRPVPTASVIKLAILYEALEQIRSGRVHFSDRLNLHREDQVPGSGVLLMLDTPMTVTFKDALTLMIAMSDNSAANLAMDHLGIENIDRRLVSLGMRNTWLYKKVFLPAGGPMPADQKQFGLGKTTAREMAGLMERFSTCNLGPPAVPSAGSAIPPEIPSDKDLCSSAIHMLEVQFYRDGLPRYLEGQGKYPSISAIANKTGSLDHVRNDVGLVFTKQGTIVISEFTHDNADTRWTPENEAELLIARLAQTVVSAWAPKP